MTIESWHLWVIGGVLLMGLEMLGLGFVALALGVAGLVGAAVAATDASLSLQIGSAVLAALILIPLFVRGFRKFSKPREATGLAGELRGGGTATALVSQQGRLGVVITGDFFPAEAAEGESAARLQAGVRVVIEGFSGITARVRVANSTEE